MVRNLPLFLISRASLITELIGHFHTIVFKYRRLLGLDLRLWSGESKITDLYITILVDQNVGRFDVSVDDIGGMKKLDGTQDLINEDKHVLLIQLHLLNWVKYFFEVWIHKL